MQLTITFPSDDQGYSLTGNSLKECSDYMDLSLHPYIIVGLTVDGKNTVAKPDCIFYSTHYASLSKLGTYITHSSADGSEIYASSS